MRSIDHLIEDETVPKGTIVTDRAYYPNARPEKWGIPMRQAGYKLPGDFRRGDKTGYYGVQGATEGAVLVDGTWFCPAVAKNERFVNARRNRDTGTITQEAFEEIVRQRAPYALKMKDWNKTTGNVRFECPAKGTCPSVSCSLAKKVPSKRKDARKTPKMLLPISPKQQPAPHERGSLCEQGSVTIPLFWDTQSGGDKRSSAGDGESPVGTYSRFEQLGPLYGSEEWKQKFGFARNVVETRNALLKGDDGVRMGSTKSRLMRGWINKFFLATVGVAALNLRLIQTWLDVERDLIDGSGAGPGGPGGRPKKIRRKFRKRLIDVASGSDPPVAA